jgi:hypothetical protein
MPITAANRELIPKASYSAYKTNLQIFCRQYDASFVDLDNNTTFCNNEFSDSVHLNTAGSIKFFKLIASHVVQHKLLQEPL